MEKLIKLFIYRKRITKPYIDFVLKFASSLSYFMSIAMIVALIYEYGFVLPADRTIFIHKLYAWVCSTFVTSAALHLIFDYNVTRERSKGLTWIVNMLLYMTVIAAITRECQQPEWVRYMLGVFDSHYYRMAIITTIALLQLSNGAVQLLSRRINQSFIFSASFIIIILFGTGLLMLPRSTFEGISFVDALFTSTSATCVTGLATVDVSSVFTNFGLFIILILIQIGGLGVMTLTCFFAMSFMGNTSLNNQAMLSDMVSSKSISSLVTTLIYILGFTIVIELAGSVLIWLSIRDTLEMTLHEEIAFSIFHSISAFCNAGFSTMSNNLGNELLMGGHNLFYLTISMLIVSGGIGFPILVNIYETLKYNIEHFVNYHIRGKQLSMKRVHLYNINTRIVLNMTLLLIVVGTVAVAALEWNKAFETMPVIDKIVQSFFTAVCPRTAGFNSVTISSFSIQTIMLIIVLMMIGGGTQSTAGGIKVNVFAVVMLNLRAILYGTTQVTALGRQLSDDSVRRSNSTLILYLLFMFLGLFILSILEPEANTMALLFESISALSTVGASLDLTPTLSDGSKVVIIVLMFVGRVGVLTMMSSIIQQRKVVKYKYPSDDIIIN